jgi:aspartyl-tRNA(Asn)/glutamyl-tRNA(Gln) amidotransferase subunit A
VKLGPDILDLPVTELSARLRARTLSPVALTEGYLARIERVAPRLNCFITVTAELAREEARRAEAEIAGGRWRGPLHGIPYAAKDVFDTKNVRTTFGARPYARRVPDRDATAVTRLREAGAVLLGKTSMIELAGALGVTWATASLNGACRTPWDITRWAGGSSSGSAAAVAAGLVGFALGTETMGSLLCPAAFCGVTALRPTYGLVSRHGVMPFAPTGDKVGALARSAADCAVVLAALSARDPQDPSSIDPPQPMSAKLAHLPAGLRVASLAPPNDYPVHPSIPVFYEDALGMLRAAGMKVERAELPDLPWDAVAEVVFTAEALVAFEQLVKSGRTKELSDPLHQAHHGGRDLYRLDALATDYVKAQAVRGVMQREMARFFDRYDLVVAPNSPILPPLVDDPLPGAGGGVMRLAGNLVGFPAAAVPMGFVEPGRLPVSLEIAGPPLADARVLAAAAALQARTRWHLARPPELA